MSVESEMGKGATFGDASQSQKPVSDAGQPDPPALRGMRVLLAEDSEINQMFATEILCSAGCQVSVVANGQEALEAVRRGGLDLVLMDCQMPTMDGLEATRRIRSYETESKKGAHIPIIALTANAIKGDRELCLAAGMDGYVAKPIEAAEVIATIQSLAPMAQRRGRAALDGGMTAGGAAPSASVDETLAVDFNALRRRCLGNRKLAARALETFVGAIGSYVQELSQNLQRGDAKSAATTAHKIKGAAGNVSAQQVLRIASELEKLSKTEALSQTEQAVAELQVEVERVRQFVNTSLKELVKA